MTVRRRIARLTLGLALIALVATALAACTAQGRGLASSDHGAILWSVQLDNQGSQNSWTFTGYIRFIGPSFIFTSAGNVYYDVGQSSDGIDVVDGNGNLNGRPVTYTISYNEQTNYTTFEADGTGSSSHFHRSIKGNLLSKVVINSQ